MVTENTRGSKRVPRAVWVLVGVAALTGLTVAAVRPWTASSESSAASMLLAQAPGTATVSIPVEGMIYFLCASSVKRTVQAVEGVSAAEVDLAARRATIAYVEGKTSPNQIAAAIARLGYKTGAPVIENRR